VRTRKLKNLTLNSFAGSRYFLTGKFNGIDFTLWINP